MGSLSFKKFRPRYLVFKQIHTLSTCLDWILQLISGLRSLHLLDIVHRDLRNDNLVFLMIIPGLPLSMWKATGESVRLLNYLATLTCILNGPRSQIPMI
ncbi:hypothetical protein LY76DRAFT_655327 [Colletotrichum caudatum]|nr:hypothetical protein LY76DRAFT_655327 [Colletotrichum caudatum]